MFALREIVDQALYSLADEESGTDEMSVCMELWSDLDYLWKFFKANAQALLYYDLTLSEAVELVANQSEVFFIKLFEASKSKNFGNTLDHIFRPLHKNDDFDIPVVEAKAYSGSHREPRMLRLLAIRLQGGTYIFVGGLIKTTRAYQDCEEGRALLKKTESLANFLRRNGYTGPQELGELLF
jgi:hypothetical protein